MLRSNTSNSYQGFKDNSCKVYLEALFKDKILNQENKGDNVTILVDVKKTDIENIKRLLPTESVEIAKHPESSNEIFRISFNKESLMKFFIDTMKNLFNLAQQKIGQKAEIQPGREFIYNCENRTEGIRLDYKRSDALQNAFHSLYKDFGMASLKPTHSNRANSSLILNISDAPNFILAQRMQYQLPEVLLDSLPESFPRTLMDVVCNYLSAFSMFNKSKDTSLIVSNPELESSKKLTT